MYVRILLTTLMMISAAPVMAMEPLPAEDDLFGMAPVGDNELSKHRGGFITPGGLQLDFALTTSTIINGELQRSLTVASNSLQNLTTEQMRQVIQIGDNNNFDNVDAVLNNPSVTTVIQNSLDGTVIQNFNTLDLNVDNLNAMRANIPVQNAIDDQVMAIR
jgi:hypothetical protein